MTQRSFLLAACVVSFLVPIGAAALDGTALDENSAALLAFQRDRIAARDPARHMISSALRPPARRPHVTHGRAEATGFWGRLFGR